MKTIDLNKIQTIIDEIRYSMKDLNIRNEIFDQMVKENNHDDYCMAKAQSRCLEKIHYIGGLSEALRFIGFNVEFSIRTEPTGSHYYESVKVSI